MHRLSSFFWLLLITGFFVCHAPAPGRTEDLPEVRVALVSYGETPARVLASLEPLARLLQTKTKGNAKLIFAVGTYADVISWIEQEKVDAAVVTPGVAAYLAARKGQNAAKHWRYLLSEENPDNGSVCLTVKGSPLSSVDDLKREAAQKNVQFLFVDPLSVSGRILPERALRHLGISIPPDAREYTSSHGTSLQKILAERTGATGHKNYFVI